MLLDKKTLLKIWLYPGLHLTVFRGTEPGVISFSVIKEIREGKGNEKEQENKSAGPSKKKSILFCQLTVLSYCLQNNRFQACNKNFAQEKCNWILAPETCNGKLGPIHRYPDIFESATFSFRIRLPFIRWIRHTNPQLFESALQSGNFLIRYESEIMLTLNLDIFLSGDVTRLSPVLYLSAVLSLLYLASWNLVSSLITCVQLNLAMMTVQWHYEVSIHVGRTNWTH